MSRAQAAAPDPAPRCGRPDGFARASALVAVSRASRSAWRRRKAWLERAVVFDVADLPDVKKVYRAFEKLGFELMDEEETAAVDADFPMQPTPATSLSACPCRA